MRWTSESIVQYSRESNAYRSNLVSWSGTSISMSINRVSAWSPKFTMRVAATCKTDAIWDTPIKSCQSGRWSDKVHMQHYFVLFKLPLLREKGEQHHWTVRCRTAQLCWDMKTNKFWMPNLYIHCWLLNRGWNFELVKHPQICSLHKMQLAVGGTMHGLYEQTIS